MVSNHAQSVIASSMLPIEAYLDPLVRPAKIDTILLVFINGSKPVVMLLVQCADRYFKAKSNKPNNSSKQGCIFFPWQNPRDQRLFTFPRLPRRERSIK